MKFSLPQILNLPSRYRANLINSLSGVKTPVLIGTKNQENILNVAIFNSLLHVGAHPPLMGILFRPDNSARHTLHNIIETNYYTINYIPEHLIEKAHQTAAKYPASVSEFQACEFDPLWTEFSAPYVKGSPIRIGMQLKEQVEIKSNKTILIIGEIKEVFLEGVSIDEEGNANITEGNIASIVGLNTYHQSKKLFKLSYAQPHETLTKVF